MKVLVVGSGGREHALAWKLAQSPHVEALWCAPGNAGIAGEALRSGVPAQCVPIGAEDLPALRQFAAERKAGLTVVGPDNPLALGIVDEFQAHGLRIWGPNKSAARFEASKAFSQDFMARHGIPTARSGTFSDAAAARQFASELGGKCAVKADGLALGKGVLMCQSEAEAGAAIHEMLVQGTFGQAGRRIVIQEYLEGMEVSVHALCDGQTARLFPASQDHKRALDGDQGLNTGGMGAYSPVPFVSDRDWRAIQQSVLDRWIAGCQAEGIDYRGIIYPGIMLTQSGPRVLEFNARFGDPETQVYMMRLENDLLELLEASMAGTLRAHPLRWRPEAAVCVVMASGGYPGDYAKGKPVEGVEAAEALPGVKVFHAGTARQNGRLVTSGGRVLGVTALGTDLRGAREQAGRAVAAIRFEGAHFRRDIAAKALAV